MFHKKNIECRYNHLVLGRDTSYFVKINTLIVPKTDIIKMPKFLIDNIFAMFGGRVFQWTVAYIWIQEKLEDLLLPKGKQIT